MKIAFRADASIQIGTGHVMRCLTLAEELRRQGHACLFICRDHPGHLGGLIESKGFELHMLTGTEPVANDDQDNPHASWLGATWQQDASQTLEVLTSVTVDWLVVDHYALDARWERKVAVTVDRVMVIDDLADREHECSLLLDQNVLENRVKQQYRSKVNTHCSLLLGPKYALLRPEYAALAKALPERDGIIDRVLIFVGGSDPYHLTECYLGTLARLEFSYLSVDVVIGINHPSPGTVKQLVNNRPKTRLYSGLPSLSALMVRADLMLGAGGTTNWERMCLGLNAIVASTAKNQENCNDLLGEQQIFHFLGNAKYVSMGDFYVALNEVLVCPAKVSEQSNRMRAIVDGNGCEKICKILDVKCI